MRQVPRGPVGAALENVLDRALLRLEGGSLFALGLVHDLVDCGRQLLGVQPARKLELLDLVLVPHMLLVVIIKLLLAKGGPSLEEAFGEGMILPLDALGLPLAVDEVEAADSAEALVPLLHLDRLLPRDARPLTRRYLHQLVQQRLVASVDLKVFLVHLELLVALHLVLKPPDLLLDFGAAHNGGARAEQHPRGQRRHPDAPRASARDLLKLPLVLLPVAKA